ncbi:MAG: hypothetical protein BWX69_03046 [Planctomycetes bacterium ADurb.Bin069]|nr:MAG: hypothetical protein BWX69_03046 [Planctomycetes bacterium ADurb.Bin069]
MYAAWLRTGPGDPDRFWSLTPRLYLLELIAFAERARAARAASITAAWTTAMLVRAASLPALETLLDLPPARALSAAEADAQLRAMAGSLPRKSWTEWLSPPSET